MAGTRHAGREKDELLEFYRGAIGEFQGFKDAYRNFIMHMRERGDYDEDEARSLITRVAHFMTRLGNKIDEQEHALTPKRLQRLQEKLEAQEREAKEKEA